LDKSLVRENDRGVPAAIIERERERERERKSGREKR
jgi:hypothetical protein